MGGNGESDATRNIFKKKKVMTIKQLCDHINCSERTVQRRLKLWVTHTSYNQNGRYYVLAGVPRFDEHGLWKYRGIFFSKYGNLRKTVHAVINSSMSGFTAPELEKMMEVSLRSFLSQERTIGFSKKEKMGSHFVYFSSDEHAYLYQKQKRQEHDALIKLTALPTDAEAVIILVERIKYPSLRIEELSTRLKRKGHSASPQAIESLFANHRILKKTLNMK